MKATTKQQQTRMRILEQNQSLRENGLLGFHSDGTAVMAVFWTFDPNKEISQIKINRDGTIKA